MIGGFYFIAAVDAGFLANTVALAFHGETAAAR